MTASAFDALAGFHPLIQQWFTRDVGEPTDVQAQAWPRIAASEHVLISAPTGSGKTLTAFLWALNQLLTGAWDGGQVRVLYVSPLRALNTDIRRNLQAPLEALRERFREAEVEVPGIQVLTRSGDTPQSVRQRMLRRPPEILITTPESLNILLTSKGGRRLLGGLRTVILDEIHAVAATKRGTHLITGVDRLVPLSGEFQRIALSATIRPMETIAEFVGGYELRETEGGVAYSKRRVALVRSTTSKTYEMRVRHPMGGGDLDVEDETLWKALSQDFRRVIRGNRSTLLFANSRRMTEKVTRFINEGTGQELAYSHHGSLSREVRSVVEKRLKEGELKAIVATNSLELGIDVGALDEVVLIQTPRAVASAIQRIGRAGHGVGEVSRGVFYPTHGRDFLDAAVVTRSIKEQDIEAVKPILAPLDVLAQVILSMVVAEPWNVDDLYDALRTSAPYHGLKRRQLDLVIDMLTGRYADSRIRDLRPRASFDRIDNTLRARRGVERILYMSGGTIADRGYFALRLEDSMAKLGELDEEFVWERSTGDSFTLGAQSWQIRKITHNDVLVAPSRRGASMAPFWRADAQDRDHFFSQKIARFLGRVEQRLDTPELELELRQEHCLEPEAAAELLDFLRSQKAATEHLPTARRLLIEHTSGSMGDETREQVILHTFWGGTVNRPWVIALRAAWQERHGEPLEVYQDDDCVLMRLPKGVDPRELLTLVAPEQIEALLRQQLEQTGFFGARFRANASTALLLPRAGFRNRTPLWLHRQRSKKLLEAVAPYGDFPMLVETWRTCLQDEFDLESLKTSLQKVEEGEVELHEVRTQSPSPFAANLMWQHTNHFMYADDSPEASGSSNLRQDLLKELVFESHLRPRLPRPLVEQFHAKIQRTAEGYAPRPGRDLVDWVRERVLLPWEEWRQLVLAVARDHEAGVAEIRASVAERVAALRLPGSKRRSVLALDSLPRLLRALELEPADVALSSLSENGESPFEALDALELERLVGEGVAGRGEAEAEDTAWGLRLQIVAEWLCFYGPLAPVHLATTFGFSDQDLRRLLEGLQEAQRVVIDQLIVDAEALEVCDAANLETLLRWLRTSRRPAFEALAAEQLPLFLAAHQGLTERGSSVEDLQERIEKLFGYGAPAALWEAEMLPARLDPYYPSWLDSLMQQSDLQWLGTGKARLAFTFPTDLELFFEGEEDPESDDDPVPEGDGEGKAADSDAARLAELFPHGGKADLAELATRDGGTTASVSEDLWRLAWAGRVSNDSFVAVRKGLENNFQPSEVKPSRRGPRSRRRAAFDRWKSSRSYFGSWFPVVPPEEPRDALDQDELAKDRIRLLLQRYGVVFRQLLEREPSPLRWARVFRALRLMELSGEVLAGHFFQGVQGLQFMSHAAFRELQQGLPQDAIYWLSAADPASCASVDVEGLKGTLPSRLASNHLVYHGARLVMVSQRRGKELDVRCRPDHPHLGDYFEILKVLLTREVRPLPSIEVETINGEPATRSAYRAALGEIFRVTREPRCLKLWKQY
ncbi:MAG: DEAD/DEAH box helicase [Acidobacteriota bacterium]